MQTDLKKRLPSFRLRLITLTVSAIAVALLVSMTVFFLLTNNVLGSYIRNDLSFVMDETSGNLANKMTWVEDMLLSIRKSEVLLSAFSGKTLPNEEMTTASALKEVTDLYSDKNIVSTGMPFVETVYLFGSNGMVGRSDYFEHLTAQQLQIDTTYRMLYAEFMRSGLDMMIETTENSINIFYTVYNQWADPLGTAIFVLNRTGVRHYLDKIDEYENPFWILTDKHGIPVLQSSGVAPARTELGNLIAVDRGSGYEYTINSTRYLTRTRFLSMGLRCVAGMPTNRLSSLLYKTVLPYLLTAVLLTLALGIGLFFSVIRLTKPLFQLTSNLQKVARQDFQVRLPDYDTEEFYTVSTAFNTMTTTIEYLIHDVYEKQLLAKDSEIRVLQSQLNPHFMFNVLHTIALKAKLNGDNEVSCMASNFAGLTRARLSHNRDDKIPISQELQYVRFYLDLQTARFEDKLNNHITVHDCALLNCLVPRLTMEMIVENAVAHGSEPKDGPGTVSIDISPCEDGICIAIADDGIGFARGDGLISLPLAPQSDGGCRHNHIALNSVYTLLHHFYDPPYGICIESKQNEGTRVKIIIPREEVHK